MATKKNISSKTSNFFAVLSCSSFFYPHPTVKSLFKFGFPLVVESDEAEKPNEAQTQEMNLLINKENL